MLTINYIKKYNFYKVTCPDDNYITNSDNSVISKQIYVPGTSSEEQINTEYHCITTQEYDAIIAEQEAEREARRAKFEEEE